MVTSLFVGRQDKNCWWFGTRVSGAVAAKTLKQVIPNIQKSVSIIAPQAFFQTTKHTIAQKKSNIIHHFSMLFESLVRMVVSG